MVWWFSVCISWPLTLSGSCHRRPLLQRNQLGSKLRLPQRRLLERHQSPARRNDMQARRICMFHLWKFWNMKIEVKHGFFFWLAYLSFLSGFHVFGGGLFEAVFAGILMFHLRLQTNDIIHRYIQTSRRHEGRAYAKPSMRRGLLHSKEEWQCVCHSMLQHKIDPGYSWLFIQRSTDLTWRRV